MRIAVNVRLLKKNKLDGIGWFTYHTLKNIVEKNPDDEFIFIFDKKFDDEFVFGSNVKFIIVPPVTRHPILWWIWLNISIPFILRKFKPDVFFSPDGFIPNYKKCRIVNVIHDINFVHYPKDLPFFTRVFYNYFFPRFAKKSDKLLTVSEYSKKDLIENYNIENTKIYVVYNGSDEIYKPIENENISIVKQKYTDGNDYFVFVGSLHPRKNIKRLILAFNKFKSNSNSKLKLIIVGAKFFKNSEMFDIYNSLEYKEDIIFTGRLEKIELHKVVASSIAMVFVPYFEGFGIPILEAMNCNVAVISSNVTSMPEVAGDAALYVNPFDIDDISNAMYKIAFDEDFRNELIEKAKVQRNKFSWQKTAEKVWEAIKLV